jgi:4-hydroxybenzoate polyprenyltransferase
VFLPLFFSGDLFDAQRSGRTFLAFVSFSFIASSVYIVNDIKDAEQDRRHERKKNRPIASGAVPVRHAAILSAVLALGALVIDITANGSLLSASMLSAYALMNAAYSFGLKRCPIVDVFILAAGFLIRVFFGAIAAEVVISKWLYMTIFTASLFLGLGKRRNELVKNGQGGDGTTRSVLRYYSYHFLDMNMYVCMALFMVFYSLWSFEAAASARRGGGTFSCATIPIVFAMFMKYSLSIESDSEGDPVELLLHDKVLLFLSILCAVLFFVFLYG